MRDGRAVCGSRTILRQHYIATSPITNPNPYFNQNSNPKKFAKSHLNLTTIIYTLTKSFVTRWRCCNKGVYRSVHQCFLVFYHQVHSLIKDIVLTIINGTFKWYALKKILVSGSVPLLIRNLRHF